MSKEDTDTAVRSKCYRSMKKNEQPHSLSVVFNNTDVVKHQCSCAAGKGLCHHVLGLLFTLAHYQMLKLKSVPPILSKTSKPQVHILLNTQTTMFSSKHSPLATCLTVHEN